MRGRDVEILGSPKYSALDDIPICKSNSKMCKFITCSARNFQNDESISNLNLAAQMLADTKLRKTIASDPGILLTVCQEQGLSPTQCKLFANAFQLINRFISTIEPLEDSKKLHRYIIKDDPYYDDSDAPPVPVQPGVYQNVGSQTWSTSGKSISDSKSMSQKMQLKEKTNLSGVSALSHPVKSLLNPLDFPNLNIATTTSIPMGSMLTSSPSTSMTLFTFPPLIFTLPTLATVAPVISHTTPPAGLRLDMSQPVNLMAKQMQMLLSHFDNKLLLPNIMSLPLPILMHPEQFKPMSSTQSVRKKRSNDYYDNIEEDNDETRNTGPSIYSDNNQQVIKLQKKKIGGKSLFDCVKYLKDS
ncbi:hypothetical protein LOAG_01200 [Loa loa]|nr:hypothetical protein LOAG_01200 [Loa loa]EFO27282.1 hypothetical protein LOAG_01200 [Loa loa]